MTARNRWYYMVKVSRLSGYLLFFVMLLFVFTGFALCGKYGVDRLISPRDALAIHQLFDVPLVILFALHSAAVLYLSIRRWGWLKR
jgi:hypothetical protein